MLAKVIDKRSPFYGMICDVGHMTEEGLHRISEKGAAWHTGYAYADQLQPITEEIAIQVKCPECEQSHAMTICKESLELYSLNYDGTYTDREEPFCIDCLMHAE